MNKSSPVPAIIYCHGCRSELLIVPKDDFTEIHRVVKQNGKWASILEECFKEVSEDICPLSNCQSPNIQMMDQETKLQRLLAQLAEKEKE